MLKYGSAQLYRKLADQGCFQNPRGMWARVLNSSPTCGILLPAVPPFVQSDFPPARLTSGTGAQLDENNYLYVQTIGRFIMATRRTWHPLPICHFGYLNRDHNPHFLYQRGTARILMKGICNLLSSWALKETNHADFTATMGAILR